MKNNIAVKVPSPSNPQPDSKLHEAIYLGVDLAKAWLVVTRIIDHGTPQPAQRFRWDPFVGFAQKQLSVARKVFVVYEAGAFGFGLARQLQELGIECLVCHPEKLDPRHKRVQTDKLDSRHLADKLQRYVLGNKKALVPVYIPTLQEEQARVQSRHRRTLEKEARSFKARGQGLLLSQGIFATRGWWQLPRWLQLQPELCPEVAAALSDYRAVILDLEQRCQKVEKQLEAAAPEQLPVGFGRLTFVMLQRELCNFQRFENRRQIGGFTGLCGAVSSSGTYHLDLSINKAGNPYLRTLLIESAWRLIYWQPRYTGLKVWNRLGGPKALVHARRRKIAIVAVARQLAVDLWRWQTGQVTAQQLGWRMNRGD